MFKLKSVIILFVVVLLVWGIGTQVQASNLTLDLTNFTTTNSTIDDDNSNETTNEATLNVATNVATNEEKVQVVQPSTNTNVTDTSSSRNNLPQTGVTEDITVMFFIIVCVISAIYAYKKIRDYKS